MRILFVQKVKALAGSENYFLELIPALERQGISVELLCVYNIPDEEKVTLFIDACRRNSIKLHLLRTRSDTALGKTLNFIRRVIRKGRYDLVHTHLIHADFWLALLKKFRLVRLPVVSTKHGYDEAYLSNFGFDAGPVRKDRYYRICRFAEKHIDRSFAVSEGLRSFFIDAGICAPEKIITIHHGFDLPAMEHRHDPQYRLADRQILIVGRIIPFKGHRLLVEALPIVRKSFPDFKLVIAGHGDADLIDGLKTEIRRLNLEDHVEFTGYTSEVHRYLANSDVMVVPSIAEGFGLIFLEAYNARTPIIGFDVPATNEIIQPEKTGLLVPPYDTRLLGEAIVRLLGDPALAQRLSEAGHQRLRNYFNLQRMVDQTCTFYESVQACRDDSGKAG